MNLSNFEPQGKLCPLLSLSARPIPTVRPTATPDASLSTSIPFDTLPESDSLLDCPWLTTQETHSRDSLQHSLTTSNSLYPISSWSRHTSPSSSHTLLSNVSTSSHRIHTPMHGMAPMAPNLSQSSSQTSHLPSYHLPLQPTPLTHQIGHASFTPCSTQAASLAPDRPNRSTSDFLHSVLCTSPFPTVASSCPPYPLVPFPCPQNHSSLPPLSSQGISSYSGKRLHQRMVNPLHPVILPLPLPHHPPLRPVHLTTTTSSSTNPYPSTQFMDQRSCPSPIVATPSTTTLTLQPYPSPTRNVAIASLNGPSMIKSPIPFTPSSSSSSSVTPSTPSLSVSSTTSQSQSSFPSATSFSSTPISVSSLPPSSNASPTDPLTDGLHWRETIPLSSAPIPSTTTPPTSSTSRHFSSMESSDMPILCPNVGCPNSPSSLSDTSLETSISPLPLPSSSVASSSSSSSLSSSTKNPIFTRSGSHIVADDISIDAYSQTTASSELSSNHHPKTTPSSYHHSSSASTLSLIEACSPHSTLGSDEPVTTCALTYRSAMSELVLRAQTFAGGRYLNALWVADVAHHCAMRAFYV